MADFGLHFSRGGDGYTLDWNGDYIWAKMLGAAKIGVQACMEIAVTEARANHPDYPPPSEPGERFANRTLQTIEAIQIIDDAQIEMRPYDTMLGPHVWGSWGVRDAPAFQDPDEWREVRGFRHPMEGEGQSVSIVDRAMFLEFGTAKMAPRPFLYPAWDHTKFLLRPLIAEAYDGLLRGVPKT